MRASVLVMALVGAGCSSSGRPVPAPAATTVEAARPAAPTVTLPPALLGTWISVDGAAFLALADGGAVLNLPGLPRRAARVTAVVAVGAAAELRLDDGATLVLASGRATGERTLGGLTLTADRAVLDVAVGGAPAAGTVRLWGEGEATWLPLMAAAPAPAATIPNPDARLLAAADSTTEPLLAVAARDILALARRGAAATELDAAWSEHARKVRLSALERFDAQVATPTPAALAEADRLVAALTRCSEAYAAWRAERG